MNKNLLQIHAKSFYWASFFLSKKIFYQCSVLYNFCRTLDDIVDSEKQLEIRKKEFSNFKNDFLNKNLNNQIIKEMWDLINSQNISKIIILDLFDGVETDLKKSLKIIPNYGIGQLKILVTFGNQLLSFIKFHLLKIKIQN